jgi:hypothetical protein
MYIDSYWWLAAELLVLAPTGKQQILFIEKVCVEVST